MFRLGVLAASAVVIAGAAFLTGASVPPKPDDGPIKLDRVKATGGQKTGYFNMAAIMRGYKKAKTRVEQLNTTRIRITGNYRGMLAMQTYLLHPPAAENIEEIMHGFSRVVDPPPPQPLPPTLTRSIQKAEEEISQRLNKMTTHLITEIYDDIHAMTIETARERGLVAVITFADALTQQELNDPIVKELKLKPPAAMPFYLDPSVDYTQELLERLNAKFDAANKGK